MMTFLISDNYGLSASVLDWHRLGNQRGEAKRILSVNLAKKYPNDWLICSKCNKLFHDDSEHWDHKEFEFHSLLSLQKSKNYKVHYENHPMVLFWRGYEMSLCRYGIAICNEWMKRGYQDNTRHFFLKMLNEYRKENDMIDPPWINSRELHIAHKASLLRKNHKWYSQFGWKVDISTPSYYPVTKDSTPQ